MSNLLFFQKINKNVIYNNHIGISLKGAVYNSPALLHRDYNMHITQALKGRNTQPINFKKSLRNVIIYACLFLVEKTQ